MTLQKKLWLNHPEALQLAIRQEKARRNLSDFALYTDDSYVLNWHHQVLCQYLDDFVAGKRRRVMVFMPPRMGKSELVSRKLPAFLLGKNPDLNIIATSYSADLAHKMNRDVQRIMDSVPYQEVFPKSRLSGKGNKEGGGYFRNTDIFEIVGCSGSYRSAGVGGGITGMGGDFIIIDDPIKNKEEAKSATRRDNLWDWYTSTLYTRLEGEGALLVTLTRWHSDDLAGRLLEQMKKDPFADQWDILSFPAVFQEENPHPLDIRKDGEALWPEKFNAEDLKKIKANVGTYDWSAMYQQMPQPLEGAIFRREWCNGRYGALPSGTTLIQTWDLPFKNSEASAKCAGLVMGRKGGEIFVVDCINEKMDFTTSVAAIKNMTAKHPQAIAKVVEDKANGPAIINFLQKDVAGMIPFSPKGSKEDRALSVAPYFQAGNVSFPENTAWVGDLVEDLLRFPTGLYKDTVDALVQGILYLMDTPTTLTLKEGAILKQESFWLGSNSDSYGF
ncbi:MAG: phage terminase large subunit [Eubacteriales bacterium]